MPPVIPFNQPVPPKGPPSISSLRYTQERQWMDARARALGTSVVDNGNWITCGLHLEGNWLRAELASGGCLYLDLDGSSPSNIKHVYGDILRRYRSLGGVASWLGGPLSDEGNFSEGGRISVFQHGAIYWWPDTGAIDLRNVALQYRGLVCFGETDEASDSDEPYVVLGVIGPAGPVALRSNVYDDVDSGESRQDWIELYRGPPTGLSVNVLLMEHDEGDPDKYTAAMQAAVSGVFSAAGLLITLIPVVGPIISAAVTPILSALGNPVGKALSHALGTDDDVIGQEATAFSAKDLVLLASRTGYAQDRGIFYKRETGLLSGDGGSYKVYFAVDPV